jgi:hypothetical protein
MSNPKGLRRVNKNSKYEIKELPKDLEGFIPDPEIWKRISEPNDRLEIPAGLQATTSLSKEERMEIVSPGKQVPLFFSGWSASPNVFVRGALFSATTSRQDREYYFDWMPVITWSENSSISVKGERLSQLEHNIFLVLLSLYSEQGLQFKDRLTISTYAILKRLGKKNLHSYQYEVLKTSLERMVSTTFQINVRWTTYTGSLLYDAFLDKNQDNKWSIAINPQLVVLFQDHQYSYLKLDDHLGLKTSLSQWLNCFITSHSFKTIQMRVDRLHALCGSPTKQMRTFRLQLKKAFGEMEAAGIIQKGWSVSTDLAKFKPRKRAKRIPVH